MKHAGTRRVEFFKPAQTGQRVQIADCDVKQTLNRFRGGLVFEGLDRLCKITF